MNVSRLLFFSHHNMMNADVSNSTALALNFSLKMTEQAWNWELKVERLRKVLEKQALDRTYDVSESARSMDYCSIGNVSVVNY